MRVGLDGETLGNDYQDTLADLQMDFAVELRNPEKEPDNPDNPKKPEEEKEKKKKKTVTEEEEKIIKKNTSTEKSTTVKTGDYNDTLPYLIAAGVSGLILLILAFYSLHERRRQRGGRS